MNFVRKAYSLVFYALIFCDMNAAGSTETGGPAALFIAEKNNQNSASLDLVTENNALVGQRAIAPKRVRITVALHGTVGALLHAFNPFKTLYDHLDEECLTVKLLKRYRGFDGQFQDQLMLGDGLVEIPRDKIRDSVKGVLSPSYAKTGALYILNFYDTLQEKLGRTADVELYATFGWSGMVGQRPCYDCAHELYKSLNDLRKWSRDVHGVEPEFVLIGYSRGGHPILYLAREEFRYRKNLKIDTAIFLGLPIQRESARYLLCPMFKNIFSLYSLGDWVQTVDRFSTRYRRSYRKMSDLVDLEAFALRHPECTRADVQILTNHEPHRIDHYNWWMMGKSKRIFPWLAPLPLISLIPLVISEVEKYAQECNDLIACIHGKKALSVVIKSRCCHGRYIFYGQSDDLYADIMPLVAQVRKFWHTDDSTEIPVFSSTICASSEKFIE